MSQQTIVDEAVRIAATEGRAPEQADFMTAAVLNQASMSAEERRWLMADLRAAELGTSTEGLCGCDSGVGYRSGWRDDGYYDEDEDDLYGEKCPDCSEDLNYCTCSDQPVKFFNLYVGCPKNPDWYDYEFRVPEPDVEATKQRFLASHAEKCGCDAQIEITVEES